MKDHGQTGRYAWIVGLDTQSVYKHVLVDTITMVENSTTPLDNVDCDFKFQGATFLMINWTVYCCASQKTNLSTFMFTRGFEK